MKKALWQDSKTKFIDRVVRAHDRDLYAERSHDGKIVIYRESRRLSKFYDDGQTVMHYVFDSPQLVFALTDTWHINGQPRDWGSEVVLSRLKKLDTWNNVDMLENLNKEVEERARIKEKDMKNQNEAWLSDNKRMFQRAFDGIMTNSLDKTERRRRRFEKSKELKSK